MLGLLPAACRPSCIAKKLGSVSKCGWQPRNAPQAALQGGRHRHSQPGLSHRKSSALTPRAKRKKAELEQEAAPAQDWAPLPPPPLAAEQAEAKALPTSQAAGLAYLLVVALLWGSYTPALRLAYNLPGPPTPVVLTAVSGVLELVVLLAALAVSQQQQQQQAEKKQQQRQQAEQQQQSESQQRQRGEGQRLGGGSWHPAEGAAAAAREAGTAADDLPWGLPAALLAGVEIGAYNSVGSLSQIAGLSMTTAARGAFLIQGSTLFTPILSSLAGSAPGRPVWLGSLLAFVGTLIIAADRTASPGPDAAVAGGEAAAAAAAALPLGDALTLLAALCYSAATVRIPVWAVQRRVTPLQIAVGKAVALTAVAAAGLAVEAAQAAGQGQPLAALWPGWQQPEGWAILVWAALGPGALASVLHVKGQSLVSPSAAQIVFCTVPVWSALLAAAALPGEPIGQGTWLGGAVVAAAGLVAARGKAARGGAGEPAPQAQQPSRKEDDMPS